MPPVLAQNNANGMPDEVVLAVILVIGVFVLVALVIAIFFLLTLHKALARCRTHNRTMEPGMVWLNLVPIFSLAWQFVTVLRVAESLRNEFRDRGWHRRGDDYGQSIGITECIMTVLSCIPYCGALFAMIGLVFFIIYWVKIAGYSGQLATGADRDDDHDDRYEDDDDRPRGRYDDDDDDDNRPPRNRR